MLLVVAALWLWRRQIAQSERYGVWDTARGGSDGGMRQSESFAPVGLTMPPKEYEPTMLSPVSGMSIASAPFLYTQKTSEQMASDLNYTTPHIAAQPFQMRQIGRAHV